MWGLWTCRSESIGCSSQTDNIGRAVWPVNSIPRGDTNTDTGRHGDRRTWYHWQTDRQTDIYGNEVAGYESMISTYRTRRATGRKQREAAITSARSSILDAYHVRVIGTSRQILQQSLFKVFSSAVDRHCPWRSNLWPISELISINKSMNTFFKHRLINLYKQTLFNQSTIILFLYYFVHSPQNLRGTMSFLF